MLQEVAFRLKRKNDFLIFIKSRGVESRFPGLYLVPILPQTTFPPVESFRTRHFVQIRENPYKFIVRKKQYEIF